MSEQKLCPECGGRMTEQIDRNAPVTASLPPHYLYFSKCDSCGHETERYSRIDAEIEAFMNEPKTEGGFLAACGVLGWQEGDEPAEVSIRRLRDSIPDSFLFDEPHTDEWDRMKRFMAHREQQGNE